MRDRAEPSAREVAFIAHEANRVLQALQGDATIPVSPHWYDAGIAQHNSVIDGVELARAALAAGSEVDPELSHRNWCDFKRKQGWTLGPVKDEYAKTHPLLVPYDELPSAAKLKDKLFLAIVKALS